MAHPTNNYVSILFMDVKAAFSSIVPECFFRNMRLRRISEEYINWYRTRMTGRATTLEFDDYCSPLFQSGSSINQGCPLLALAFLFYNADTLNIANRKNGEFALGFINDIILLARGPSFHAAIAKLVNMLERTGGCLDWSRSHQTEFGIDKTALIQHRPQGPY